MTRQPSPYSDTARVDPLDHRLARVASLPPADLATLRDARRILSVAARDAADEGSTAAGTPADLRFAEALSAAVTTILALEQHRSPRTP